MPGCVCCNHTEAVVDVDPSYSETCDTPPYPWPPRAACLGGVASEATVSAEDVNVPLPQVIGAGVATCGVTTCEVLQPEAYPAADCNCNGESRRSDEATPEATQAREPNVAAAAIASDQPLSEGDEELPDTLSALRPSRPCEGGLASMDMLGEESEIFEARVTARASLETRETIPAAHASTVQSHSSIASMMSLACQLKGRRVSQDELDVVDPLLLTLLSFEGHKKLLRASHSITALRGFGAILQDSAGSDATFAMSSEVTSIDTFISHNWAVPRKLKFFCIALHFNSGLALLAALATLIVAEAITYQFGISVPLKGDPQFVAIAAAEDPAEASVRGVLGALLVAPVFILTVCCGHELRRLAGSNGPTVFLDKTCVNQMDADAQRKAIQKLGAFLRRSSQMLVVYSDIYLRKLWTVYEVACYLSLYSVDRMVFIPTFTPVVVLSTIVTLYLVCALDLCLGAVLIGIPPELRGFLALFIMTFLFRHWAHVSMGIQERLAGFSVSECMCSIEEDRILVCRNIALLMRVVGEVGRRVPDEEALEAFNGIVRKSLSGVLIHAPVLSYRHVIAILVCTALPDSLDHVVAAKAQQRGPLSREDVCWALIQVAGLLGFVPLTVTLLEKWCKSCLHLKGWQERAFQWLGATLLVLIAMPAAALIGHLQARASDGDNLCLVGVILVAVLAPLLAMWVFARRDVMKERQAMKSIHLPRSHSSLM